MGAAAVRSHSGEEAVSGNPLDPAVLAATPEGRAEALLRRMEKDGWIDADWWAEAEPRRPEENLQGIVAAVIREAVLAEREACAKRAEAEPNLPGEMPDKLWQAYRRCEGRKDLREKLDRSLVAETIKCVAEGIRSRPKP